LNSPLGREAAAGFAGRLAAQEDRDAVALAYRMAFGRAPSATEARVAAGFLAHQIALYERAARPDPTHAALVDFCQSLMGSSEFIYSP
jgi:hypothetical protein